MTEELKRCPWQMPNESSHAIYARDNNLCPETNIAHTEICCLDCNVKIIYTCTRLEEAINKWNRRVGDE